MISKTLGEEDWRDTWRRGLARHLAKRIGQTLGKEDWRDTWQRGLARSLAKKNGEEKEIGE